MKLLAALTVSIPMLVAQTERPALHSVTAVRHWSLAGATRVAVEVSGGFNFVTERLYNPDRVYFDIPDSRPRFGARRGYSEQVADKLLSRIRVAETMPGVTRIVLDLTGAVEATASQLTNPDRLIIELRSGSAPSPAPVTPTALAEPPAIRPPAPVLTSPPVIKPEPRKTDLFPPPGIPAKTDVAVQNAPEPPEPGKLAVAAPPAPVVAPPPASEISKAARHTSTGQTSLVRALGLKLGRVVIDPGHGGHDQGTIGPKGLQEKDLVLDVAQRVGKLVDDRLGAEVIYTRTDDTFVPLEGRTELANDRKADLFLSIHANSSPVRGIAGVETYYLNFTDVKDALDVAARENASSQKSIFELRDIIQKITQHDKAEESKEFAGRIQAALYGFSAKDFPNSPNRGVKKAPFVVLIGANMPSVLAEIGFLSNPREEALLKKPDYRQRLAEALFRGLSRYADSLSHFQVAQAQN